MTTRVEALVSSEVLKWARESTAWGLDEAARAAGVRPAVLLQAEHGERRITFRQLQALAKAFRLPLRTMFLPQPPQEGEFPVDYRSATPSEARSPSLIKAIRVARQRRTVLLELLDDQHEGGQPLPNPEDDAGIIGVLTPLFCVPLFPNAVQVPADGAGALSATKKLVEQQLPLAVFETSRSIEGVRGCSLYEPPLSIVILNSTDIPNARRFTLAHEIAHLLMRESGICDPFRDAGQTEQRCNAIAGEAMLPRRLMLERLSNPRKAEEEIPNLARDFRMSYSAVAVRLRQAEFLSKKRLRELLETYEAEYHARRQTQSESTGGPNYYLLQALRLGSKFTAAVLDGFAAGELSTTQTADLLGVAPSHIAIDEVREKATATYDR